MGRANPYLYQLPMPQPTDDGIGANPDALQRAKSALPVTWPRVGTSLPVRPRCCSAAREGVFFTAQAHGQLRVESDKIVARLYGITDAALRRLLRSFNGMATKRLKSLALLP